MPDAQLAILIPTVNRADVLAGLVENIAETTEVPRRTYFVMEDWDEDTIAATMELDAAKVIGKFGSNAKAVNGGYHVTKEPFVALLNDDVRCTAGWDLAALARMNDETHIVGINQGNGVCTSFSIVRRSFIEEHSGVFDKPNTLYHEYVSQFPDTEFAEYAKQRGVWADAPDAVVEHLHWTMGKGDPNDPNYVKARETWDADEAVFLERRKRWTTA
jgi:GT2 family glycosyltransferase